MRILSLILVVLLMHLLGDITVQLSGLPLPAPIFGMAYFLAFLIIVPTYARDIRPAVTIFLGHMMLYFIPAAVGIMDEVTRYGVDIATVMILVVGTTLLSIVISALTFVLVSKWVAHD